VPAVYQMPNDHTHHETRSLRTMGAIAAAPVLTRLSHVALVKVALHVSRMSPRVQ
jgi:hypothetical protein